jgi:hypothetical protein
MFKRNELKNGRAHQVGKQFGKQSMSGRQCKGGKSSTPFSQYQQYQRRSRENKPKDFTPMTEDEKRWFPDVWAEMLQEMSLPVREVEADCPYKRQGPMVEAQVVREMRIYRKCSRNCNPTPLGGCKGWTRWASCPPPPEPKEEF